MAWPPLDGTRLPPASLQLPDRSGTKRNHRRRRAVRVGVPLSCAVLVVNADAASVVTTAGARVVNDCTVPTDSPSELDAIAQYNTWCSR